MLVRPSLIKPPTNLTAKIHTTVQFQCHFKASTIKYLTATEWFKDEDITPITNTSKHQIIQVSDPEKDNTIFSELSISNVSGSDQGNYSCYCYYNETVLNEYYINTAVHTTKGYAVLTLQGMCVFYNMQNI